MVPSCQTDEFWMARALELADKGLGRTSPNPIVGAVIVKHGRLIGSGYHDRFGGPHAEMIALKNARSSVKNATLYSTLEPCAHFGKTPPCVHAILKSGIRRVVIGQRDPNPRTRGRGIRILRSRGLRVTTGILARKAMAKNLPFQKWIRTGLPFVTLKVAQSIDGKITNQKGRRATLSSKRSRDAVQHLRKVSDAILVGIQTVLIDNPRLSVRVKTSKQPYKIILDGRLCISPNARVFKGGGRVILAALKSSSKTKRSRLGQKCEILNLPSHQGRVALKPLLRALGRRGIAHLLVEGGGEVLASFIRERLADEVYVFVSPRFIGGRDVPTSVEGPPLPTAARFKLNALEIQRSGSDVVLHGYL